MRVGRLELPAPHRLVVLREIAHDVLALVPLAALHRHVTEDVAHRGAEPLRSIEHDEERLIEWEAALAQVAEELRNDAPVLTRRLHEPQHALLPRGRHAQCKHELIASERLAVEHEHQPLGIVTPSFLQPPELVGTRANEAP